MHLTQPQRQLYHQRGMVPSPAPSGRSTASAPQATHERSAEGRPHAERSADGTPTHRAELDEAPVGEF